MLLNGFFSDIYSIYLTIMKLIIFKNISLSGMGFIALLVGLWACKTKETAPTPASVTLVQNCLPATIKTLNTEGYLLTVSKGEYDNSALLVSTNFYDVTSYVKNSKVTHLYNNTYNPDGSLAITEAFRDSTSKVTGGSVLFPDRKVVYSRSSAGQTGLYYYDYAALHYRSSCKNYSTYENTGNIVAKLVINTPNDRTNTVTSKQLLAFDTDADGNIIRVKQDTAFAKPFASPSFLNIAEATYNANFKLPVNQVVNAITPSIIDSLPFKYLPETFTHYVKKPGNIYILDKSTSFIASVVTTDPASKKPTTIKLKFQTGDSAIYQIGYVYCE